MTITTIGFYDILDEFVVSRGQATTTSATLPDLALPQGFVLENIDASNALYIMEGTATAADGFRIKAGGSRFFNMPNPKALSVITSSGTADFQIGATRVRAPA